MFYALVLVHTIPGGVRYLLEVQEMGCQSYVSHLGIVKELNFDSLCQWGKLLNKGDLFIPYWVAGGVGD